MSRDHHRLDLRTPTSDEVLNRDLLGRVLLAVAILALLAIAWLGTR